MMIYFHSAFMDSLWYLVQLVIEIPAVKCPAWLLVKVQPYLCREGSIAQFFLSCYETGDQRDQRGFASKFGRSWSWIVWGHPILCLWLYDLAPSPRNLWVTDHWGSSLIGSTASGWNDCAWKPFGNSPTLKFGCYIYVNIYIYHIF
jgi:hypothetical protein